MAVVVAQIPEPPTAGPGLEDHGERRAVRRYACRAHLLQSCLEAFVGRRFDADLLLSVRSFCLGSEEGSKRVETVLDLGDLIA